MSGETGTLNVKLNRNQLKYVLIVAMLIDHLAGSFVYTNTFLGQFLHFIGRLTGPGMALLLAEGYQYTSNKKKYALRLFMFTLVSWIPYSLRNFYEWPYFGFGMFGIIWTLFISFMTIWMWDELKVNKAVKILLLIVGFGLSLLGDWLGSALLWAVFAYIYRDNAAKKWISYSIIGVIWVIGSMFYYNDFKYQYYQLGIFLVPVIFTFFYNGKPGSKAPFHKWFFYIFYPLHLLILYLVVRAVRGR